MGMSISAPGLLLVVLSTVVLSSTRADIVMPLAAAVFTVSFNREASTSGTITKLCTPAGATGSSHTGCQIPLEDVYMIPPG